MAPLYPFFFDVGGFPGVRLIGITREQQERNIRSFRSLMRMAHERGISVTAAIWDHIHRGGVQGGGIEGASDSAGKEVPGLVAGATTENLAPCTKAALRRFLEAFPELDGLEFRMHTESGLKKSEMAGFWHEVFGFLYQIFPTSSRRPHMSSSPSREPGDRPLNLELGDIPTPPAWRKCRQYGP